MNNQTPTELLHKVAAGKPLSVSGFFNPMSFFSMKRLFILGSTACMMVCLAAFYPAPADLKSKLENLSGTYADPAPYPYGKAWGKRVFTFDKGRWTLTFTLGLDPELRMQVFQFRTKGTFKLQQPSKSISDTYEAVFYEDKKYVTLKTSDQDLIQAFGFAACGLKPNQETDISANGCAAWLSVKDCPGDYDLLSMDQSGKLYFGERPADNNMCSPDRRPKKLTPAVIKQ